MALSDILRSGGVMAGFRPSRRIDEDEEEQAVRRMDEAVAAQIEQQAYGGLEALYGGMVPSLGGGQPAVPREAIERPELAAPYGMEVGRAIGGGLADTLRSAAEFQEDYTPTGLVERAFGRPRPSETIPEIAQPETAIGSMVRPMVPPLLSGAAAGLAGGGLGTSMLTGALADAFMIPPTDPNVSSTVQEYLPNPITGALAVNPEDPAILNRLRNALESATLIGGLGGIGKGLGALGRTPAASEPVMSLSEMARIAAQEHPGALRPVRPMRQPMVPSGFEMPGMPSPRFAPDQPPMGPTTPRTPQIPEEHRGAGEYLEEVGEGFAPKAAAIEVDELAPRLGRETETAARGLEGVTPETVLGEAAPPPGAGAMEVNINFDNLSTPEDVNNAIAQVSNTMGGFAEARRGVVSDEQLRSLANDLGMTPDRLSKSAPQELMSPERMLAARGILQQSGRRLVDISQRYRAAVEQAGGRITAAPQGIRDEFMSALRQHAGIQEAVQGATAEAGRLLRQYQLVPQEQAVTDLAAMLPGVQGMSRGHMDLALNNIADRLAHTDSDDAATALLGQVRNLSRRERFFDGIYWIWINSILSGPQTHAVNIGSNALTQMWDIGEHGLAAGIGAARTAIRGGSDRVYFREIPARIMGAWQGMRDGFRSAGRVFRGLEEGFNVGEEAKTGLSREPIRLPNGSLVPFTPTRALSAEDVFFRTTAERMETVGRAYRDGLEQGMRGEDLANHVRNYLDNIAEQHPDVLDAASRRGHELTFTEPFESPHFRAFQRFIREFQIPGTGFKPLRYVAPFISTPTNLIVWAGRRTPLGIFARSYKRAIQQGGAAADLARARVVAGTGVMAGVYGLWENGIITGAGPSEWNERQAMMRQGWQPYSIRTPWGWVSYRRYDPLSIMMGQTTDLLEAIDNADFSGNILDDAMAVGGGLVSAASQAVDDKTWFSGISRAIDAWNEPERYGERFIQGVGLGFWPNAAAQTARMIDPQLRETDGLIEKFLERVPMERSRLALRRDLWGREIRREYVGRVSPAQISEPQPNPVDRELQRLGYFPGTPYYGRYRGIFTPEQFSEFSRIRGSTLYNALNEAIQTPEYENMTDEDKIQHIRNIIRSTHREAREEIIEVTPELLEAARGNVVNQWSEWGAGEGLARALADVRLSRENERLFSTMSPGSLPGNPNLTPQQVERHAQIWTSLMEREFQNRQDEYNALETEEERHDFLYGIGEGARDEADQIAMQEFGLGEDQVVPDEPTAERAIEQTSIPFGGPEDVLGQGVQSLDTDVTQGALDADIRTRMDSGASQYLATTLVNMDYSPRHLTRSRSAPQNMTDEEAVRQEQLFYQEYNMLVDENRAEISNLDPDELRSLMADLARSARETSYSIINNQRNSQEIETEVE